MAADRSLSAAPDVAASARPTGLAALGAAAASALLGGGVALSGRLFAYLAATGILAVAIAIPVELFLGGALLLRNLTDPAAVAPTGDFVGAAAPIRDGGTNLSALIGILMIAVAVIRMALYPRSGPRPFWPLLIVALLVVWSAIGYAAYGSDPSISRELLRSVSIVAVGVLAVMATRRVGSRRVVWFLVIATAAPAVVAVLQALGVGTDLVAEVASGRARGTFAHENSAATAFALGLAACVWLALTARSGAWRLPATLAVLFATALLATLSLGGVAGAITALAILTIRLPSRRTAVRIGKWALATAAAALVLAPPISARLSEVESAQPFTVVSQTGQTSNSFDWRFFDWSQMLDSWEQRPLLGNGLGTSLEIITPLGTDSHSDYVRILVETGLIGLLATAFVAAILVRRLWRATRSGRSEPSDGIELLALAVLGGAMVHGIVDTVSASTAPVYLIVALVCSALAARGGQASDGGAITSAPGREWAPQDGLGIR